ncbi:MAG: ROK family glucokinase [Lachnospiraceae bacterium]|nr:ROK family glucokinase [Lachnospiraceae bacterium]
MKKYAVGADVGGTTVKLGLFTTEGDLLEKWEIPTRTEDGGKYIFPDIASSVKEVLEKKNLTFDDLEGVGLDVPGPVLPDGTVNRSVNIGWGVIKAADMMSEAMGGLRATVLNDANAAALGEMWKGAGKGNKDVCMITLGTGVGGGIIVDGKIVPGAFGAGGEIGHITINPNEKTRCNCGKYGCLEQYASGRGIAQVCERRLSETDEPSSLRNIKNPTAKEIYAEAGKGDKFASDLVDEISSMLAMVMSFVSGVTDPKVFVIGGGVSKNGPIVTERIEKFFKEYAFHASKDAKVVLAELGNDAGMYGAVKALL